MIRDLIQLRVSEAVERLKASGALPADLAVPVEIVDPKDPSHGDFATSWALAASKAAGKNPRELADLLRTELEEKSTPSREGGGRGVGGLVPEASTSAGKGGQSSTTPQPPPSKEGEQSALFSSIEVAGPGFLNFRVADDAWREAVAWANDLAEDLNRLQGPNAPTPQRLNVEFVSVNPNGPITVGSGRGAAYGSTLSNVLEAAGHTVHREYYINDGVNSEQMRLFAESLLHARLNLARKIDLKRSDIDEWVINHFWRITGFLGKENLAFDENWFHNKLLEYANALPRDEGAFSVDGQSVVDLDPFASWLQMTFRHWLVEPDVVERLLSPDFESKKYKGDYVAELVEVIVADEGRIAHTNKLEWWRERSQALMIARQRVDLASFGVIFDTWFSEQSLHDSGKVEAAIEQLVANGSADEKPVRRKLKLAKGGVVEDVIVEEQPVEEDDGEGADERNEIRETKNENDSNCDTATQQHRNTLWLRSTRFADDMDRVLRRKDGRLTYIASDVAYHKDKFNRPQGPNGEKADKLITILGPDHHGYIGRLHAVLAALELGEDKSYMSYKSDATLNDIEAKLYESPAERDACHAATQKAKEELEVLIFQIVRFVKEGKPAPMRKRDGNIYSLRDLMVEIGKDAAPNATPEEQVRTGKDVARFFYLMRSHDTHMDFDIDLATKGTDENPVFYVQYAHARICSILRKAEGEGLRAKGESTDSSIVDRQSSIEPLHPKESALIKKILDLPEEVRRAAEDYGVHRLATYAIELARTFHHFYDACRVIQPEQPELTRWRLSLCAATRHALKGALDLLGVSAPERMERDGSQTS